jgi:hypothetical protein
MYYGIVKQTVGYYVEYQFRQYPHKVQRDAEKAEPVEPEKARALRGFMSYCGTIRADGVGTVIVTKEQLERIGVKCA